MGCMPRKIVEQLKITEMVSAFERCFRADGVFAGEYHEPWECLYVESGNVCVSGDDRVYYMNPGDIIFHKPQEFHKFNINNPEGAELFIFAFSMEGELCDFFKNSVFCLTERQKGVISELIEYLAEKAAGEKQKDPDIKDYIGVFEKSPSCAQMAVVYLQQLFLMIYESGSYAPGLTTTDAVTFGNIVRFMQKNVDKNLSVEDIARNCCLSVTSLKRIFAEFAGMGIHRYFMQMKINKATQLLEEGKNVTETAEILGFTEQSYFSKVYKKKTGVSPSGRKR